VVFVIETPPSWFGSCVCTALAQVLRSLKLKQVSALSILFDSSITDVLFVAAIRACLPGHWEFCFYDADIECGPSPQLEGLYPGPFYTNFVIPTLAVMRDTHQWLLDIVEEDGPFDGFMGFSAVRSELPHRTGSPLTERL
jgi:hypothetical protein